MTNRILALPIFAVVMFAVYYVAMGPFGTFLTDWTNDVLFGDRLCRRTVPERPAGGLGAPTGC